MKLNKYMISCTILSTIIHIIQETDYIDALYGRQCNTDTYAHMHLKLIAMISIWMIEYSKFLILEIWIRFTQSIKFIQIGIRWMPTPCHVKWDLDPSWYINKSIIHRVKISGFSLWYTNVKSISVLKARYSNNNIKENMK